MGISTTVLVRAGVRALWFGVPEVSQPPAPERPCWRRRMVGESRNGIRSIRLSVWLRWYFHSFKGRPEPHCFHSRVSFVRKDTGYQRSLFAQSGPLDGPALQGQLCQNRNADDLEARHIGLPPCLRSGMRPESLRYVNEPVRKLSQRRALPGRRIPLFLANYRDQAECAVVYSLAAHRPPSPA